MFCPTLPSPFIFGCLFGLYSVAALVFQRRPRTLHYSKIVPAIDGEGGQPWTGGGTVAVEVLPMKMQTTTLSPLGPASELPAAAAPLPS